MMTVLIYTRKRSNMLYLDYTYKGVRYQKSSGYTNTPENRKILEEKLIPEIETKARFGILEEKIKTSFGRYAEEWLETKQDDKSFRQRVKVRAKVLEYWGKKDVTKITRMDVKRYLDSLQIKGQSKRVYLSMIRGVLDIAMDDDVLTRNVALNIDLRHTETEVHPFSKDEVNLILSKARDDLRNYLGIGFYTGMRSGEILGLMKDDIDLDKKTISISRSISKGNITTPKTKTSIREIPLFENVIPYIEDQFFRSTIKTDRSYLFTNPNTGGPYHDIMVFRRRKWERLLKECQLDYRRIYMTRHTFVTAMLDSNKYKITDIAKIVGHANIEMIMTTYAKYIKDQHLKVDTGIDIFG